MLGMFKIAMPSKEMLSRSKVMPSHFTKDKGQERKRERERERENGGSKRERDYIISIIKVFLLKHLCSNEITISRSC